LASSEGSLIKRGGGRRTSELREGEKAGGNQKKGGDFFNRPDNWGAVIKGFPPLGKTKEKQRKANFFLEGSDSIPGEGGEIQSRSSGGSL